MKSPDCKIRSFRFLSPVEGRQLQAARSPQGYGVSGLREIQNLAVIKLHLDIEVILTSLGLVVELFDELDFKFLRVTLFQLALVGITFESFLVRNRRFRIIVEHVLGEITLQLEFLELIVLHEVGNSEPPSAEELRILREEVNQQKLYI